MDKTVIWDRTPPQLYINCSVYVWGRVQGSQIFKQNSIISIHSKGIFSDFIVSVVPVVPTLSLSSPHCPCHPHVIPMSSPSSPHHSHSPRRSPCGPHSCGLRGLHPMLSPLSLRSPCHPRGFHIIPIIPMSCRRFPHHP